MGLCTASVGKHHHAVKNAWMLGAVGGFAAEFVIIRRAKEKLRRVQRRADSPLICAFICLTVGNGRKKKDATKASQKVFFLGVLPAGFCVIRAAPQQRRSRVLAWRW